MAWASTCAAMRRSASAATPSIVFASRPARPGGRAGSVIGKGGGLAVGQKNLDLGRIGDAECGPPLHKGRVAGLERAEDGAESRLAAAIFGEDQAVALELNILGGAVVQKTSYVFDRNQF